MTFEAKSHFTALTAYIVFESNVVGALQSLKIDDNYNTVRVGQIGSPVDLAHMPGRVQVNLSARRMVVNTDLIMTYLRPVVANGGEDVTTTFTGSGAESFLLNSKYSNVTNLNALAAGNRYFNFTFDILVKDPSAKTIYTIKDCNVVSRSVTIDQGSIVISEDVTLFGRYIDYEPTDDQKLQGLAR